MNKTLFLIRQTTKNPLFSGSLIMIFGSLSASFFNYLYHLTMGRMLGPDHYGSLASIVSLVGLLAVTPSSLGLVVTKFISSAKDDSEKKDFIDYFFPKMIGAGVVSFVLLSVLSPLFSTFLHINSPFLLILSFAMFIFTIPSFFLRSTMQGLLKFKEYTISFLLENFARVFFAVVLVLIGFGVGGAVLSLVIGSILGFVFVLFNLKKILERKTKESSFNLRPVFFYALPVLAQSLAVSSLYSTDLLLVKHFFSSFDAGIYASLSFLGRIIFFGASPVAMAMFPLISKKHSSGEKYNRVFIYSFLAAFLMSGGVLLIYWLLPGLAIEALYGRAYLSAAGLLLAFGAFITLLTLSYVLINFFLAVGKTRAVLPFIIAAFLQVVGISLFHSGLAQVIEVSIICSGALLASLILYYFISTDFTKNLSHDIL